MIKMSKEFMDYDVDLVILNNFYRQKNNFYFACNEIDEDLYEGVKLKRTDKRNEYMIIDVITFKDEWYEKNNKFKSNVKIIESDTLNKAEILNDFFEILKYANTKEELSFNEDITKLVKLGENHTYKYSEGKEIRLEIFDIFEISGKVNWGYYDGVVMLTDITLSNRFTEEIIEKFENIQVETSLYNENEDEEGNYLLEVYASDGIDEKKAKNLLMPLLN